MSRRSIFRIGLALLALVAVTALRAPLAMTARYEKAPEFPSADPKDWIGAPQSMKALAGKVIILDVWTFG